MPYISDQWPMRKWVWFTRGFCEQTERMRGERFRESGILNFWFRWVNFEPHKAWLHAIHICFIRYIAVLTPVNGVEAMLESTNWNCCNGIDDRQPVEEIMQLDFHGVFFLCLALLRFNCRREIYDYVKFWLVVRWCMPCLTLETSEEIFQKKIDALICVGRFWIYCSIAAAPGERMNRKKKQMRNSWPVNAAIPDQSHVRHRKKKSLDIERIPIWAAVFSLR